MHPMNYCRAGSNNNIIWVITCGGCGRSQFLNFILYFYAFTLTLKDNVIFIKTKHLDGAAAAADEEAQLAALRRH